VEEAEAGTRRAGSGEAADLPERVVTVNMLIAHNLAFFRKVAGMTQEELGEHLAGGWTKVAVSAAERSWDGQRVRKFDADVIADIATALAVPIAALFLPPEDDGTEFNYRIRTPGTGWRCEELTMKEWFPYVVSEPGWEAGTPVLDAYTRRFAKAAGRYLDAAAEEELANRISELANEQQFAKALHEARDNEAVLNSIYDAIDDIIADNQLLQRVLQRALRSTPEGRALIDERPSAWKTLPEAHRAWQAELARIAKEMFGERGPVNRGQVDQVIAEARRLGIEDGGAAAVLLRDDGTYQLVQPPEDADEVPPEARQ
jgi:transcriptional regulator with XRE-family HTH domain